MKKTLYKILIIIESIICLFLTGITFFVAYDDLTTFIIVLWFVTTYLLSVLIERRD